MEAMTGLMDRSTEGGGWLACSPNEVLGLWLGYSIDGFLSPYLTHQAKFYTLEMPLTFANYTNSFPWEIIGA